MIKFDELNNMAILVDFDGTITTEDTNDKLIEIYWNDRIEKLWDMYRNNKIDLLTLIELQFSEVKITEEEYTNFILDQFTITKGFVEFYRNVEKNNISFAIASGGFDNGIIPFLVKHGINNVDIYANSFIFNDDNISVKFYDGKDFTCCNSQHCSNCKVRHYKKYKEYYDTVVFIGDGSTDKCVSEVADMVFAKGNLLDYCREKNINCIPWKDFHDISKQIFNIER